MKTRVLMPVGKTMKSPVFSSAFHERRQRRRRRDELAPGQVTPSSSKARFYIDLIS